MKKVMQSSKWNQVVGQPYISWTNPTLTAWMSWWPCTPQPVYAVLQERKISRRSSAWLLTQRVILNFPLSYRRGHFLTPYLEKRLQSNCVYFKLQSALKNTKRERSHLNALPLHWYYFREEEAQRLWLHWFPATYCIQQVHKLESLFSMK